MKKFFSSILLFFFFVSNIFLFSGCNENEFIEICELEYTTNGMTTNKNSTFNISPNGDDLNSTQEEFNSAEEEYKFFNSPFTKINLSKNSKTISSWGGLSQEYIGNMIYYKEPFFGSYRYIKWEFAGFVYTYISVKVVNTTTIVVRDWQGDTTYTVTSYRITYFD